MKTRVANKDSAVVISADGTYSKPCLSLINSILVSAEPEGLRADIIILGAGWTADDRMKLDRVMCEHGLAAEVVELQVAPPSRDPLPGHWTPAIYNRLYIGQELAHYERLLYLDSDIIALTSINRLLDLGLQGQAIGAVEDLCIGDTRARPYFNAGVLLIDTAQWLSASVAEASTDLLTQHPEWRYHDQDALNVIFDGKWLKLDQRWNVFHFSELELTEAPTITRAATEDLLSLEDDAFLLHYVGRLKPWHDAYPTGRNLARFKRFADSEPITASQ